MNVCFGILDETTGFIFFPDLTDKIDFNAGFFVNDPLGIEFLRELWDFYWESSKLRYSSQ